MAKTGIQIHPRPADWVQEVAPEDVTLRQLWKGLKPSHARAAIAAFIALIVGTGTTGMLAGQVLEARSSTREIRDAHQAAADAERADAMCKQNAAQSKHAQEIQILQMQLNAEKAQWMCEQKLATCETHTEPPYRAPKGALGRPKTAE